MKRIDELKAQLVARGWRRNGKGRWKHKALGARTFTLMGAAIVSRLRSKGDGLLGRRVDKPCVYTAREAAFWKANRQARYSLKRGSKR